MERYGYRDKARIISIVDMVWSTINLGNTFLGFLALSAYYSYWNSIDHDHRSSASVSAAGVVQSSATSGGSPAMSPSGNGEIVFSPRAFRKLAWMMVMAQFAIHFSQLTFAINLYTGTAKNATAKAPAACRLWFITSSLLLGILGLRLFFQVREANGIFCMSEIIFRAVGMYLVGEYAKEVKNTLIYPPPPPVYFSSHPDQLHQHSVNGPAHSHSRHHHHSALQQHHHNTHNLNMLPFFSPPYPELPPKYEEAIRQPQRQLNCPGVVISTYNPNAAAVTSSMSQPASAAATTDSSQPSVSVASDNNSNSASDSTPDSNDHLNSVSALNPADSSTVILTDNVNTTTDSEAPVSSTNAEDADISNSTMNSSSSTLPPV